MSLAEIKRRIAKLERGTESNGSPDNFDDSIVGPVDNPEEFYAGPGMPDNVQEAKFCFGNDVSEWPLAVRQRFNV